MWAVIDTSVYIDHWERGLYVEKTVRNHVSNLFDKPAACRLDARVVSSAPDTPGAVT